MGIWRRIIFSRIARLPHRLFSAIKAAPIISVTYTVRLFASQFCHVSTPLSYSFQNLKLFYFDFQFLVILHDSVIFLEIFHGLKLFSKI